jgi:hypothetical protein
MDSTAVLIIIVFALIAIAAFVIYQRRAKVEIKGPLGTGLSIDASNDDPAKPSAVQIEDAVSKGGNIKAANETGGDAAIRRVEAQGDITATSTAPKDAAPKA